MPIGAHLPFEILFLPPKGRKGRKLALGLFVLVPLLIGALAVFLGQDINWDLRNYHWYNAYAALGGRMNTLDLLPSQTPFFYNPALDIPFFLLAHLVPAKAAAFLLGTVQGLNFILLFMLAHATLLVPNARNRVLFSALLALLGLLGGGGIAQIGTTFYDNITSLGVFLSVLLVLRNMEALYTAPLPKMLPLALLAGLPAGLMMGLKLPSAIFCVGLCGAPLFVTGKPQRRLLLSFGLGLGAFLGFALSYGAWGAFLWRSFGNPIFPYFNDVFHSSLAASVSARDTKFIPLNWHDRLLFPLIFARFPTRVGEIPWQDLRLPLLYVLLPLAVFLRLLFGRSRALADKVALPLPARYLLWMAILSYVAWVSVFAIYRYALPLEMLAPLLIVYAVGLLPLRLPTRGLVAAFLLIAITLTIQPGNWSRRASWLPSFQSVDLPALPQDGSVMFLMAGFDPYSHLIPALPPKSPVLRLQSNFSVPIPPKGMNARLQAKVDAHKGPFKLLIPSYGVKPAKEALDAFGLDVQPQSCQNVQDHLFEATYSLCDVKRKSKSHE